VHSAVEQGNSLRMPVFVSRLGWASDEGTYRRSRLLLPTDESSNHVSHMIFHA